LQPSVFTIVVFNSLVYLPTKCF